MNKSNAYLSIAMAGLLAAFGAQAQSASPSGDSDGPPAAGEASNQTRGVPNAVTTNSPFSEAPIPLSRDSVRTETQVLGAPAIAATPRQAGEASTMVMGAPNADPNNPALSASFASPQQEVVTRRARFIAWYAANGMRGTPQ
jgi:hypothetical protein